jgi:transposase
MTPAPKKRKVGRPKKSERPVTPELVQEMGSLYLRGKSERQIGQIFGLAQSTVQHHLNHTIKPLWRNAVQFEASIEIARAEEVIRLAFEGFDRSLIESTKSRERFSLEAQKSKIRKKAPKRASGRPAQRLVERTLETIQRDGDKGWLELVHLMMDFKAKVKGGYAPSRFHVSQQTELRVAGLTPSELDQKMLERMADLLAERQRHKAIIASAARSAGLDN